MHPTAPTTILKINSSSRSDTSHSRVLVNRLVARLKQGNPGAKVIDRDVSRGIEFIDEAWIGANFAQPDQRTGPQIHRLALSNELVGELGVANLIVIGVPIYNFGIPASLKAWVDQIARANVTFRYTDAGPQGLLTGKKAYLVVTSGGTKVGSEIDFATSYMRHILGFIGIDDVTVIAADQLMSETTEQLAAAKHLIHTLSWQNPIQASVDAGSGSVS